MIKQVKYRSLTLLFLAMSVLLLQSCKKQNPRIYTIKGKIENLKGKSIFFARDYPDSTFVDTIQVDKDGSFLYEGLTDSLTIGTLFFNNGSSQTSIFIDKGLDVNVKGDASIPDLISVKGGDVNNDLTDFKKKNKDLLMARGKLISELSPPLQVSKTPGGSPDLNSKLNSLNFQLTNRASEYIRNNPDKIASVIFIQDFFKNENSTKLMDKKIESLTKPASTFPLVYQLKEYIRQINASQEGSMAPYFIQKDAHGKDIRLGDYHGKYLLMSFVSADCELCMKNKEELQSISKSFKSASFEIVVFVVASDSHSPSDMKGQIASMASSDWTTIPIKESWAAKILSDYNVSDLPLNVLVDKDGKIAARGISPAGFTNKLNISSRL